MNQPTPIYLDWSFWAVFVAAVAVALSQLPKVHLWFRRASAGIEIHSRLFITHKVGNPNAQLYIIISNLGGRELRISEASLRFARNGTELCSLPIQNYLKEPNDASPVMFTPIKLKPGEEWSHIANFLSFFTRNDEQLYRRLESNLRQDIQMKKIDRPNDLVEADQVSVQPLVDFYQERFLWVSGEYEVEIHVKSDKAESKKIYQFTIFESDERELRAASADYKFGAGVYWERQDINRSLGIEIRAKDT